MDTRFDLKVSFIDKKDNDIYYSLTYTELRNLISSYSKDSFVDRYVIDVREKHYGIGNAV